LPRLPISRPPTAGEALRGGLIALFAGTLAACGGHAASPAIPLGPPGGSIAQPQVGPQGKIKHIVIVVQENRSFDNLFHGFKGANYATTGTYLDPNTGEAHTIPLKGVSFAANWELCHQYTDAVTDVDGGKMDNFDHKSGCNPDSQQLHLIYSYVLPAQTAKYFKLAESYVLGDDFFEDQLDASYVAHQYLIAAQAGTVINTPNAIPWGCDAPKGTTVQLTDDGKPTKLVFPCFTYTTLADELDAKNITWRYYAPGSPVTNHPGYIWSAYDAINGIRNGADWATNVVSPQCQVLTDAAAGNLPAVTWVVPDLTNSDHPLSKSVTGPAWVTAIVNAIGKSTLWDSTAVFVVWDDWGGFYDHVAPPTSPAVGADWDGPGMRVPIIAISPYAKQAAIDHTEHSFSSILKSVESLYVLHSMTKRDTDAKSLFADTSMFDFAQAPRKFTAFPNTYTCNPNQHEAPDTDFAPPGTPGQPINPGLVKNPNPNGNSGAGADSDG
jgi:phospholipase C